MQFIIVILLFIIAIALAPALVTIAIGVGAVFLSAWFVKFILSVLIGTIVVIALGIYFLLRETAAPTINFTRNNNAPAEAMNVMTLMAHTDQDNAWLIRTAEAIQKVKSGEADLSFSLKQGGEVVAQWRHTRDTGHTTTFFVSPYAAYPPYDLRSRNPSWLESHGFVREGIIYKKQFDPYKPWNSSELSIFVGELFRNVFSIKRRPRIQVKIMPSDRGNRLSRPKPSE